MSTPQGSNSLSPQQLAGLASDDQALGTTVMAQQAPPRQRIRLPNEILRMIWNRSLPRGDRFIFMTDNSVVLQAPPVIAHVCRDSRMVALQHGRMYQLDMGLRTWFQPKTDWLLWGACGDFGLGELAPEVENMVVPQWQVTDAAINRTMQRLIQVEGCVNLKKIGIEMGDKYMRIDTHRNPDLGRALFNMDNTIVVPDIQKLCAQWSRIDEVVQMLPPSAARYWNDNMNHGIGDDGDVELVGWEYLAGEAIMRLCYVIGEMNPLIPEDKKMAYALGDLMRPSGLMFWSDHDILHAPDFFPTCLFTRLMESERVVGEVPQGNYLLLAEGGYDSDAEMLDEFEV